MRLVCSSRRGFSTVELLMVLALGAVVIGSVVVLYGSLVSIRGSVSNDIEVTLNPVIADNFYDVTQATRRVPVAPDYGAVAQAEELREQFLMDTMSASAVFCLYRNPAIVANSLRRSWYPYDLATDGLLESSLDFRDFLIAKDASAATLFLDYRNPDALPGQRRESLPPAHASIFVVGFSEERDRLGILAIYEVDVIAMTSAKPWGLYSSVRRYTHSAADPDSADCELSGGYEVFYEPSATRVVTPSQLLREDGFSPIFVSFERRVRESVLERNRMGVDRFKKAAERPFYFVWWPDPASENLKTQGPNLPLRDPRRAYNQMGGRTSFMFTVPMFPAL